MSLDYEKNIYNVSYFVWMTIQPVVFMDVFICIV